MANVYVRSGAAGAGTGADWTNAYTTLDAAMAAKAAGDIFWVSEDHAQSSAANTNLTSPGTASNPCFAYCVNHSGSVPPVSADLRTTATISTTGNTNIVGSGYTYYYGIAFTAGNATSGNTVGFHTSSSGWTYLDTCSLNLGGTNSGSVIQVGGSGNFSILVQWKNTTVSFADTGQGITVRVGRLQWMNTASAITGAVFPTTLFPDDFSQRGGFISIEGVDLSALASGKTIIGAMVSPTVAILKDCKLGASVTVAATPPAPGGCEPYFVRTDSAGTNYRHEKYQYRGSQVVETTIVRTGGASDGTTPISWNITTTANSKWVLPYEAIPITIWNDTTGSSVTVTLYGIWGGGAVPNNDDIWMDVEYLGASGNPQGSFATATKADNLATGSALASDTSTWGGSTTKFKMTCTFTPQQKGYLNIVVKAAKASSTFYIDPLAVLS